MTDQKKEAVLAAGTIVGFELNPTTAPNIYTVVDGINSFGAVGETGEAKDQTTLADKVKRYGRGMKDTPEQTVKGYHYVGNPNQEKFIDNAVAQISSSAKIIWPSGRQAKIDLQLLGFQMDENTAEDWESWTVQARQSGDVDWTKPSTDQAPDAFDFTDVTGATVSTTVASNAVILSGMSASATIAVSGGTYTVNGGTPTSDIGIVSAGDSIVIQVEASASAGTPTEATINIGGVTDTFIVTTA